MTGFFINGTFHIDNNNYVMRFLFELDYDFEINIYIDKNKSKLLLSHNENKSKVKPLDIQINYPKIDEKGYKRFFYDVIKINTNEIEYRGLFPIISSNYEKDLNIVFLFCNDNLSNPEKWNIYHEGIDSCLWNKIGKKEHDIIIHMGCD